MSFYGVPEAEYYEIVLSDTENIPFSLKEMERIAKEHTWQIEELAKYLEGKNIEETCKNIWFFIKDNVRYDKKEAEGKDELLRTPARLFDEGKGDCDCFTITISSILTVLGIKHLYRVVAYYRDILGFPQMQHVYPVAIAPNGKEFPIDCVPEVNYCNYELPFIKKNDTYIKMTKQLGNAKDIFSMILEGFDDKSQTVNKKDFGLLILRRILEAVKQFFEGLPDDQAPATVLTELILIQNILDNWNNKEARKEALMLASKESAFDKSLYAKISDEADRYESEQGFDTIQNILRNQNLAGSSLGFADILTAAGEIVTSIFGNKAQAANNEAQIKLAQTQAASIDKQSTALVEAERLKKEAAEANADALVKSAALQAAAARNTETPSTEPRNKNLMWWIIGGAVALILIIILIVSLSRPKTVSGAKKRKYTTRSRSRSSSLRGVKNVKTGKRRKKRKSTLKGTTGNAKKKRTRRKTNKKR